MLALTPAITKMLKDRQTRQKAERLAAGQLWQNRDGLVFTNPFGAPIDPRTVLRALKNAADIAGVKDAKLHTLRHFAATTWLKNGVHLKTVSELLGHADIKTCTGMSVKTLRETP